MMTREERAKQFAPFDAMKGLQEALRDREERHSRVEKHEIAEEALRRNSSVLSRLAKGDCVRIDCYCSFHDVTKVGQITEINLALKYLKLNDDKVCFDDIYYIEMI